MFKVNLENLIKIKCALYHHWRLQPSEIENMEYWEFELSVENLQEFLKEKNDQEKKQQQEQQKNTPNAGKYMKQASSFKTPRTPNIKRPR